MRKSILVLLLLVYFTGTRAQQDAQYTQYMFNTMSVNSAYAGSRGQLSFAGLYRSQWLGVNGAPETFTMNLHSPIRDSRMGYGISIVNDNIGDGVVQETTLSAVLSYSIDVAINAKLSFGLNANGNFFSLDFDGLRNFDKDGVNQDITEDGRLNEFNPNFGMGVYYHTDRFYMGVSVPNLVRQDFFDNNGRNLISASRINYYFISGYVFDLNGNIKFKPAVLTKAVGGAPLQVDLSASFLFNDRFSFGAAYRWDAAVSALAGFQITDQVMLGLAYDRETTELGAQQFNDGTIEFFLRLELLKRFQRTISPRFF